MQKKPYYLLARVFFQCILGNVSEGFLKDLFETQNAQNSISALTLEIKDVATAKKTTPVKTATAKAPKPKNGEQYTQSEFFDCIQQVCGLNNRRIAKDVYVGFADMVQGALKKGYKLPLPGIGKIQVRQTKARMGRNPATGEAIHIPSKKRIRLTPSKALKDAVLK